MALIWQVVKIDAIYNPEYSNIIAQYKLPVFLKTPHGGSFENQGFVDNGRHQIPLTSEV